MSRPSGSSAKMMHVRSASELPADVLIARAPLTLNHFGFG
ncbi:hypothetical protein TOK_1441 [Pseudonocardia sp. N23]|nr:hypothetical protein TOK_1441 [Pseudonocardia sp. N23]